MKRLFIIVSACFAAVSLLAAEDPQPQPPAQNQTDSPLVQAAKRSNRFGKKPAVVITNDSLHSQKGAAHITTTKQTVAPTVGRTAPPDPTPEMVAADEARKRKAKADEAAAVKKKQEAEHREKMERTAAQTEQEADVLYEEDPAQTEHEMEKAAQPVTPPPAPPPPKPRSKQ